MDDDHLDVIAARKALADPERISPEDARKELGLNKATRRSLQHPETYVVVLPFDSFLAWKREQGVQHR